MKTPANKAESMGEVKEEMGTSVAEVQADPDGPTSRPLYAGKPWDLYGPLADLTASLEALIDESGGVYGLHKNGDLAPWDELTEGGRFEDWLSALAAARRALDAETAYRGTPPSALWIGDDDAADAARYRHLKNHASYYYAEGYDPPTPREFGISWEHQDCTPDRPGMDWLIDQEIAAKAFDDEEIRAEAWGYDPAENPASSQSEASAGAPATDEPPSPPAGRALLKENGDG